MDAGIQPIEQKQSDRNRLPLRKSPLVAAFTLKLGINYAEMLEEIWRNQALDK